ncbi:hypothetical protein PT974_07099 [Cladobotryum mycophilum]|uniref:Uncharacterized protein n=1 Tax=Cladobotryum mycophilum TaxID=491253 RepID=A0ABR0SNL8_9HYPO
MGNNQSARATPVGTTKGRWKRSVTKIKSIFGRGHEPEPQLPYNESIALEFLQFDGVYNEEQFEVILTQQDDVKPTPRIKAAWDRNLGKLRSRLDWNKPKKRRAIDSTDSSVQNQQNNWSNYSPDKDSSTRAVKSPGTTESHSRQQSDDPVKSPVEAPSVNDKDSVAELDSVRQGSTNTHDIVTDSTPNLGDRPSLHIETTFPPDSPQTMSTKWTQTSPESSTKVSDDKGNDSVGQENNDISTPAVKHTGLWSKPPTKPAEAEAEKLKKHPTL